MTSTIQAWVLRYALVTFAIVVLADGCSGVRMLTGPKWSERRDPNERSYGMTDLSGRSSLRFAVLGDTGTGKRDQYRVGAHLATTCRDLGGCDFVLLLGDNFYPDGVGPPRTTDRGLRWDSRFETAFERPYAGLGPTEFWAVPGNHDWYRAGSVDTEVRYGDRGGRWRMPSHDYAVPGLPGWLHLYGLDSTRFESGQEEDDAQVARARNALCDRDGWRLLFGHHPVYSSGHHADRRGELPPIRDALLEPVIETCRVHLYFAGHSHHQEHLTTPTFDTIIQGAGAKLRKLHAVRDRAPGVRSMIAERRFGFAVVEIDREHLTLRFHGDTAGGSFEEFHCRRFDRSGFADRDTRSRVCQPASGPTS